MRRRKRGRKDAGKKRKRKPGIPKVKRDQVWEQYMSGRHKDKCLCCFNTEISSNRFQCGHVLSRKEGGTEDVSNLRPICQGCNSGMGATHMKVYMKEHYPHNIENTFPPEISV